VTPVLLVHTGATLAMVGLIWFVQVVHYPLFDLVGEDRFRDYGRAHQRRVTRIVAPLMLAEAGTAVWLLASRPASVSAWQAWGGLLLLALIWISTGWIQVPLHSRLLVGYDTGIVRRLVASNWIRTLAWTARGVLALAMLPAR
jgi:hypothetical protein